MLPRPDAVGDTTCRAPRYRDASKRLGRSRASRLQRSKTAFRARSGSIGRVTQARDHGPSYQSQLPRRQCLGRAARTPTSRHATWEEYSKRHRPVTVSATRIEIVLCESIVGEGQDRLLEFPWTRTSSCRRHEIIQGVDELKRPQRAMRTKARVGFVKAFGAAHRWLDELLSDANTSLDSLAVRAGRSERSIRLTLSLAFLSPVLAEAAMDGRLPRGFSIRRLTELPVLWSEQWTALGPREPIQAQAAIGG